MVPSWIPFSVTCRSSIRGEGQLVDSGFDKMCTANDPRNPVGWCRAAFGAFNRSGEKDSSYTSEVFRQA